MKRVLITGASGFIGKYLVKTMFEHGDYEIWTLTYGDAAHFPLEVKNIELNLTDQEEVEKLSKQLPPMDVVIHLAACLSMDSNLSISVNCLGTANMIRLANDCHAGQFVYMSSIPVIGTPHSDPIREIHPVQPETLYHVTKFAGEQMLYAMGEQKMKKLIFRISSPIGIGMNSRNFLTFLIDRCNDNMDIELFGQGLRKQNYIDVREIAKGIELGVKKEMDGLYLLAGKTSVTNRELACLLRDLTGSESEITWGKREDPEEKNQWNISTEKMKQDFGWAPEMELKDTVSWILGKEDA